MENLPQRRAPRIESGGLCLGPATVPAGLDQVLGLALDQGVAAGSLVAVWKRVRRAKGYELQICVDPTAPHWIYHLSTVESWATLYGLIGGVRMWVRVRAIGADGTFGPWSDPAVVTVP